MLSHLTSLGTINLGVREMVQRLRALDALAEDQSGFSCQHSDGGSQPSITPVPADLTDMYVVHMHHTGKHSHT